MKKGTMKSERAVEGRVLIALVLFRWTLLLFGIPTATYFSPDEYWQSLEVAHHFVFGYGYLTWEWKYGLRSFLHPFLFAIPYWMLSVFHLDYPWLVRTIPYVLQAILAALSDCYTWKLSKTLFGRRIGNWSLFLSSFSWFNAYCLMRPFSNSLEATLTIVALNYWPWEFSLSISPMRQRVLTRRFHWALFIIGLGCYFRPTSVLLWIPLALDYWRRQQHPISFLLFEIIPIMMVVVALGVAVDSYYYGYLIFTPWQFLKFNVINKLSIFYGVHPWHWYILQGIPVVLGIMLPFFVGGLFLITSNKMGGGSQMGQHSYDHKAVRMLLVSAAFTLLFYSVLAHKEFRFIMPLLPIAAMVSAVALDTWRINPFGLIRSYSIEERPTKWKKFVSLLSVSSLILVNLVFIIYMSLFHQSGVVQVMKDISNEPFNITSVLVLMPCHATPFYSHVHRPNITLDFITCEPPLDNQKLEEYQDESDIFYEDPAGFLYEKFSSGGDLPSHLVMFDVLSPKLKNFLEPHDYVLVKSYYNGLFTDDSRKSGNVNLYKRHTIS